MDNLATLLPKPNKLYHICQFRAPFSLLATRLCRLYGLPNCTVFKVEWAPLAHQILTTWESFNWVQVMLVVLKESIEKSQKTPALRKPTFYLSVYVMDFFCTTFPFPTMGWNWMRVGPSIHIYCSTLWEDNLIPFIYDICDHFIGYV